jgi:tetratricopeptide (TPR) repeat protein
MSPPKHVVLKERGNVLFQKKDYRGALKCYTQALKMDDRQAVYFSNRSQCHFQLGDYNQSMVDADACIALVNKNEDSSLYYKNVWRWIRASLYYDSLDTPTSNPKISERLRELVECPDKAYSTTASKLETKLRHLPAVSHQKMTFLRSSTLHPAREYYRYHDRAVSALTCGEAGEDGDPRSVPKALFVRNLPEEEVLSILFGGVGDARHVFVTLLDLYHQQQTNVPKKKFHLTLNDIKETTLARDILLLLILHRLGQFEAYGCVATDPVAGQWATLLHYLYSGYAMPPQAFQTWTQLLDECLQFDHAHQFSAKYPWIQTPQSCFDQVRLIWIYWKNQGTPKYSFPSTVNQALSDFHPSLGNQEVPEMWKIQNPGMGRLLEEKKQQGIAGRKADMAASLADPSGWSPDLEKQIKAIAGLNASKKALQQCICRVIDSMDDSEFMHDNHFSSHGLQLDRDFLRHTRVLLPPSQSQNANPPEELFERLRHSFETTPEQYEEEFDKLIKLAKTEIKNKWK